MATNLATESEIIWCGWASESCHGNAGSQFIIYFSRRLFARL